MARGHDITQLKMDVPTAPVNRLRLRYFLACQEVGGASRKHNAVALRRLNEARTALRHYLYGPARRTLPDFDTRVDGIPCGVVVDSCTGPTYEAEYTIVTRAGYAMDWLDERVKADLDEDRSICEQIARWRHGEVPQRKAGWV
jgi:hypothetical protein